MKTKDFLERVKALGLQPIANEDVVVVYAFDYPLTLARIRNAYERSFELDLDAGQAITIDKQRSLMELVVEYGMTPLEKREDEQRWRINLAEDGFLCLKLPTREYLSVDPWVSEDYDDDKWYQIKFTWQEIADYLKTDDEAFVDNFIKRFGEEVSE